METNQENNINTSKKEPYSEIKGTGAISTLIFTIAVTVLMFIISKIIGQ